MAVDNVCIFAAAVFLATVLKKLSLTGAIMYFRFKLRLISTSFPIIIQIFSFINIVSWSHEETIFVGLFSEWNRLEDSHRKSLLEEEEERTIAAKLVTKI